MPTLEKRMGESPSYCETSFAAPACVWCHVCEHTDRQKVGIYASLYCRPDVRLIGLLSDDRVTRGMYTEQAVQMALIPKRKEVLFRGTSSRP